MPGKRAFGAKCSFSDTSGGSYTDVVNITKIRPFNQKADFMDTTSHDSSGAYREKVPTILDAGQCQIEYNFDDKAATHVGAGGLTGLLGAPKYWKITFPGSSPTVLSFQGFVVSNTPEIPYDNKMTGSAVIEITGPVAFA